MFPKRGGPEGEGGRRRGVAVDAGDPGFEEHDVKPVLDKRTIEILIILGSIIIAYIAANP